MQEANSRTLLQKMFWFYSVWFRFGGLAMAILSAIVSLWIGIQVARDRYILVNGEPSTDAKSIITAICMPLIGVGVGLALFYLVPKGRRISAERPK